MKRAYGTPCFSLLLTILQDKIEKRTVIRVDALIQTCQIAGYMADFGDWGIFVALEDGE
jgi:hypothetical protein